VTRLIYEVAERRICWPNPDATCLNGGCLHCNDHPYRSLRQIARFAAKAGVLPHRGSGSDDALEAFRYGLSHDFFNADTRAAKEDVAAYTESLGALALRELAFGMPGGAHGRPKAEVMAWLLRYRRDVLDESFRLSQRTSLR
jgi:hypothetical protein